MQITNNQNYLDAACQETGTLEALFELCAAKGVGITDLPPIGEEVMAGSIVQKPRLQMLTEKRVTIGTNGGGEVMSGIGYWALEVDFEVQ